MANIATPDFFKKLQKSSFLSTTDATYLAQLGVRVEPEIVNMHPAQDPLRQRWAPKNRVNSDRAATYTTLDEIDFATASDAFFEEGKCPPGVTYTKSQAAKVKKHYGTEGGLTNAAIAAMAGAHNTQGFDNQVMTEQERTLEVLNIAFRNSEEWAIINGDDSSNPLAFDGLAVEVATANGSLVVDLSGSDITKSDVDNVISVQALRGVAVTAIVGNPLMINHILSLYHPAGLTTPIMSEDKQFDPFSFNTIPGPYGAVALVPTPKVPVTYVSGTDYTSTVYILTEIHNGVDLLYMDYLIPQSVLPSEVFNDGSRCTSVDYGMYAVGTLVNRAPVAQAKITSAGFNASASLSSDITSLSSKKI